MLRAQLPKLDVSIPDVQMDRYSFMFGSLLGTQQPSNLLARRSKMLNHLKDASVDRDASLSQSSPNRRNLPGIGSHSTHTEIAAYLDLEPPLRPATSPAPSKSPSFSLFPQTARIGGPVQPTKQSPLQRSFTAPGRLSPMQECFEADKPQPLRPRPIKHQDSLASPTQTSASTNQEIGWSTDDSQLSPASSTSSVEEEEILFDVKPLSITEDSQEPQFEMTRPDGAAVELYRSRSQKLKAAKFSDSNHTLQPAENVSGVPKIENAYIDTPTAFAETVPPISNEPDIKPLRITKTRADNVIRNQAAPPPKLPITPKRVITSANAKPTEGVILDEISSPLAKITQRSGGLGKKNKFSDLETLLESDAASVMSVDTTIRPSTPTQKSIKLPVIPRNIPISKYSLRPPIPPSKGLEVPKPEPRPARPVPTVSEPSIRTARDRSPAVREARQKAAALTASRVEETPSVPTEGSANIAPTPQTAKSPPTPQLGLNIVIDPPPVATVSDGIASVRGSTEIAVARQVSLSRKPSKRLLIAPSRRVEALKTDEGEKIREKQAALLPTIVDADKAHRPGRSMNLVIESA